jgi:hypothetical protein
MAYPYTHTVGTQQVSAIPPPGSVMAYLGNSDPDGWVIADGQLRSTNIDKYSNLLNMGIGSIDYQLLPYRYYKLSITKKQYTLDDVWTLNGIQLYTSASPTQPFTDYAAYRFGNPTPASGTTLNNIFTGTTQSIVYRTSIIGNTANPPINIYIDCGSAITLTKFKLYGNDYLPLKSPIGYELYGTNSSSSYNDGDSSLSNWLNIMAVANTSYISPVETVPGLFSYVPPNYSGAFLRGIGTSPNSEIYEGPTLPNTYQHHKLMDHSHRGHFITMNANAGANYKFIATGDGLNSSNSIITRNATTSVSQDPLNSENSPYNYGVNWIIKV